MAGIESTSLGSVVPKKSQVEKFVAEANKKYRVGFPLLTDDGNSVRIDKVPFWNKFEDFEGGIKIKSLVTGDGEFDSKISKILGSPIYRYATPIVVYETDDNGVPVKPLRYKIIPLVFADGVLSDMISINNEFPLHLHDLVLSLKSGSDPKYQNLTFVPTSKEAIWKNEKIVNDIVEKAKQFVESGELYEAVAKRVSKDDLQSKFLTSNTSETSTPVANDDIDIDIDSII